MRSNGFSSTTPSLEAENLVTGAKSYSRWGPPPTFSRGEEVAWRLAQVGKGKRFSVHEATWTFNPTNVEWPQQQDPNLSLPTVTGPPNVNSWQGPMVTSGVVTVSGLVLNVGKTQRVVGPSLTLGAICDPRVTWQDNSISNAWRTPIEAGQIIDRSPLALNRLTYDRVTNPGIVTAFGLHSSMADALCPSTILPAPPSPLYDCEGSNPGPPFHNEDPLSALDIAPVAGGPTLATATSPGPTFADSGLVS